MLGVSASVQLFVTSRRAYISLRGLPVGGKLIGIARFAEDGMGVSLEPHLEKALNARMVAIMSAGSSGDFSKMWVRVSLPLGLGRRKLTLYRVQDDHDRLTTM